MSEFDLMAIAIPLMLGAGVAIGYMFGRLHQSDLLAEQYKIAKWQRDEAMRQRDRLVELIEEHGQNVERIWNEQR